MPEKFHNSQVAYSEISTLFSVLFCWFSPDNHSQIGIGYFGHSLYLWKGSVKQPSPFVYNHLTHADICLSNISDTRAIKSHGSTCQLWSMTSTTEDSTTSRAGCSMQAVCQQKEKKMSGGGGGRALTTYGFPFKTHESGEKREGMFIGNWIWLAWVYFSCISMCTKA